MTRDEVFVPRTASQRGYTEKETTFEKVDELLEDAPLWNLANVLAQQLCRYLSLKAPTSSMNGKSAGLYT
jgi:hypothetical protein